MTIRLFLHISFAGIWLARWDFLSACSNRRGIEWRDSYYRILFLSPSCHVVRELILANLQSKRRRQRSWRRRSGTRHDPPLPRSSSSASTVGDSQRGRLSIIRQLTQPTSTGNDEERPRARPDASAQHGRQISVTGEGIQDGSRTRRSRRRNDAGQTHNPSKANGEDGRRDDPRGA